MLFKTICRQWFVIKAEKSFCYLDSLLLYECFTKFLKLLKIKDLILIIELQITLIFNILCPIIAASK